MKYFRLHWKTTYNKTEIVQGKNIAEAMTLAGYSSGALGALDYYELVKKSEMTKEEKEKVANAR